MSVSSYTCVSPTLYFPSSGNVRQEPWTGGCLPATRDGEYAHYGECFLNCPAERHILTSDAVQASTPFASLHPGDNYKSSKRHFNPGQLSNYPWCKDPLTHGWRGEI